MDFAFVVVLQRPAAVGSPAPIDEIDSFSQARVSRCPDGLEIVESSQNIVVPSRRKSKPLEFRLDDLTGAVRTKESVDQEELAAASLCKANLPNSSSAV
jgi:hypothetical protein